MNACSKIFNYRSLVSVTVLNNKTRLFINFPKLVHKQLNMVRVK